MIKDCFDAEGQLVNRSTEPAPAETWEAVPKTKSLELLIEVLSKKYADRALERATWIL